MTDRLVAIQALAKFNKGHTSRDTLSAEHRIAYDKVLHATAQAMGLLPSTYCVERMWLRTASIDITIACFGEDRNGIMFVRHDGWGQEAIRHGNQFMTAAEFRSPVAIQLLSQLYHEGVAKIDGIDQQASSEPTPCEQ